MKLIVTRTLACLAFIAATGCGVLLVRHMQLSDTRPDAGLLTIMLCNVLTGKVLLIATQRIERRDKKE